MNWNPAAQLWNRRHFLGACGLGTARLALAAGTHFAPKAKRLIYLFMEGGPSQLDLFDDKPKLRETDGQAFPRSLLAGKKFAFMENMAAPTVYGSRAAFQKHGQSGNVLSSHLPHLAGIADQMAIVRTVQTGNVNHSPAMVLAHTGSIVPGRPSLGAWLLYGLGNESQNLPNFVSMISGPRGPRNGPDIWGSGFLPTSFQGVPFAPGPQPIYDVATQPGISHESQRRAFDVLRDLNTERRSVTGDPEIDTRIASYEMAFRMQASAPELMDLGSESKETLELYGATPGRGGFANNCLLARRLIERGVKVVHLYHTDWDHHTGIDNGLKKVCPEVDRPSSALVKDLARRGLLDDTLVIWGGEFGRTPMSEGGKRGGLGRNHQIDAYSLWMAGGGIRPGITVGETDEYGMSPIADPVPLHDLHATVLHLFGIDHTRLTYRYQGRDFRLTDTAGNVVRKLLA
ncbi:MAG TPA: DUF1501 domain-containing protein [Bryobacteraceae bacterium]|nr:DUF1501 domain-containing protein [Bryobacteraceae bacterium]